MFGKRSDGRKLKEIPPFFRVIPNVMLERSDSQVYILTARPYSVIDIIHEYFIDRGISCISKENILAVLSTTCAPA